MTNNIRQIREARGLSQSELARRLGTTSSTISRLEAGERKLSQSYISAISQVLCVEPAEVIGSGSGAAIAYALIPVIGAVSNKAWVVPTAAERAEHIPAVPSRRYARLLHSAYKVVDGDGTQLVGAGGYAITVPFNAARKAPLNGDWIVVRSREGRLERHALVTGHVDDAGGYAVINGERVDLSQEHEAVGLVVAIYRDL